MIFRVFNGDSFSVSLDVVTEMILLGGGDIGKWWCVGNKEEIGMHLSKVQ